MDSRKVSFFATIAVIVLVAVGIGYAYTAMTTNSNNSADVEYVLLTQDGTGKYTFADGDKVYWDSNDYRTATNDPEVFNYTTDYTLTAPTIGLALNNTAEKYVVAQVGESFQVKAEPQTDGKAKDGLNCQIIPKDFKVATGALAGHLFTIIKVEDDSATPNVTYFKLNADDVLYKWSGSAWAAGDTFPLADKTDTTYAINTVTVYYGYLLSEGQITVSNTTNASRQMPSATPLDDSTLTFKVTITGDNPGGTKVTTVNITKTSTSIAVSGNETLEVTVGPSEATNKFLIWTSSDSSKATVDSTGKVTGVAAGTVTITAASVEDPTIKDTCEVTITAAP